MIFTQGNLFLYSKDCRFSYAASAEFIELASHLTNLLHLIGKAELREIRSNCDWRELWQVLGIVKNETRSKMHDWWACSPLSDDKTPSFHMNDQGWYCHSTTQGGGVIELVQKVLAVKGDRLNCYQAGAWLVEQGLSRFSGSPNTNARALRHPPHHEAQARAPKQQQSVLKVNEPIRFSLVPFYAERFHPHLAARGISKKTYDYLGAGYLPNDSKSPLAGRLVFQIRSVRTGADGDFIPVMVSHIGRAIGDKAAHQGGKWHFYKGFNKSLELYNLDRLLCEERAKRQLFETRIVILTEGCFDVAALIEAGFYNAVASFGAHLAIEQLAKLKLLREVVPDLKVLLWYDRDKAGNAGVRQAGAALQAQGFEVVVFDWSRVNDELAGDVSEVERTEIVALLSGE